MLKFGVLGANGKMGAKILEVSSKFKSDADLVALFASDRFLSEKPNIGYTKFTRPNAEVLDFLIDFSNPKGTLMAAKELQGTGTLIVSGVTGFTDDETKSLKTLSKNVKILHSANFSFGVNMLFEAVKNLASPFKEYDAEILEKHHALKKDAPSGTALELGKIIAKEQNTHFDDVKSLKRDSIRKKGEIGFSSIRQGAIFGFHEVSFGNENERIWVGHESYNKNIFAEGAISAGISACIKLKGVKSGFFTMNDIGVN